ncbi:3'-flap repair endonuclease Xpf [Acidianus brierleyi]|uniref:Multidrug MFS transporter n=1 Tax=Acidianus brierleyi TaxID=41673 RepID=A0A2U9IEJ6_9CREN|nr:3'-flap repair endonuclease Xpf [Acidianus brierleyi]AWR94410.1 multidrug MFS transporter [Acidianus brierleyi]
MMIRIYADDREEASGIPSILRSLGITVFLRQLSVGDYIVGDNIAVERKSVIDLVNSIFDKRFFDQIGRLTSSYDISFLLIEGNLNRIYKITNNWKAVNSALISVMTIQNLRVIYSIDKQESAEILKKLAEKFQLNDNKKKSISLHDKPKFENIKEEQEYIVESFPQIGEILAKKLLEKFGTIKNICNANISDIEKAIGSRKKAEEIYKIINTPYSSSENNSKKSLLDFI